MWPFKKKLIEHPQVSIESQLSMAIKSASLPEVMPNWYIGSKSRTDWSVETAINEGYNASSIVFACVEKRAKLTAAVPWCVKIRKIVDGEEVWEAAPPNHPLARLIKRPNASQSWLELIYGASQNLDLSGDAYLTKLKAGIPKATRELWLIPSQYVKIKPGKQRLIDRYDVSTYGVTANREVMPEDMCQLRFPNPSSPYFGQPTLLAGGRATDVDRESGIWQKVSLENRGATDINIKLPDGATTEQVNNAREQYKKQQAGPRNARKALVTNADVQQLGQTAVELDFVASRRANWTEICAIFGMSLANLGMTESVNLANAEAMDKALYQNTIIPNLRLIKEQLNHGIAQDFGDDVMLDYDLSAVPALQQGQSEKLDEAGKLFAMGVPLADINQKLNLGLTDRPEYEVGYIPSSLIPSNYDTPEDDGSTAEEDGDEAYGSNS